MIIDTGFISEFLTERIVCITGSLGSGKTLIAHEIAEYFLKKGYRFYGNCKSEWIDDYVVELNKKGEQVKAVILCDEGGLYVRTFADVKRLASYARKLDLYIIFSGKKLPHEDLQSLVLYCWYDFFKNWRIPLKIWRYDVEVQTSKSYHGYIYQTGWWKYYGVYSTLDPGDDVEGTLKKIDKWIDRFRELYGDEVSGMDKEGGQELEAAEIFAKSSRRIVQVQKGERK